MPTREELAGALRKADAAGNVEDARRIAGAIRAFDAKAKPAAQTVNPMVAQGQAAQQAWRDGGAKPANPNPENPITQAVRSSQQKAMGQWAADRRAEANAPQDEIDRRKDAYRQKYGPDVKFAGPGFTADPNDRAEEALSVRSIISAANTVPGTVNAILEGSDTMFGSGRHFDQMTGEELQFSNSPKPQQADPVRVTFGDRGAGNGTGLPPPAVEPTRYLPQLNLSPATSVAEMGADMTGALGAYVVMPGKVIDLGFKAAGAAVRGLGPVGRAVTAITPQGAGVVDKSLRYGGRMVSTVPENAAHAFAFGAMAGEDGSRMETGAQFAADPLNYLAQPVASLIQRAGVALKTMGARVTPEAVQLQQAMQTLQRGNATPEQVRQAVATINKITPPRPAETAPLAGAADEAPGAQNAPAPVQGRSDAAIGAAKQQAETRAQLQAALDAANARGDREAAAQLESQLRDSTFIIDPQTGQRAGAATRAAQPQPIPTATQTAAGAPPIQPPPPAVASANAAVPTPGVVPPAGNLVPIPQNEAVAAFNALPPKTREAMLRTLNSAGMDANGFWSDTWRKLTGRFRNSSEAMDAIRKLGDMPEDQQVMFALELIKNNGGDLETILPAMGRKWATEGARDPQLFGGTDRAREIMDANVPKVINSQGERVAGIAEDKFGPGIVPAGEAIDVEKRVLAKQYDTLLNPQRKQYGRLRNPQKLASIDKAWNDIKAYLKRPEVIDQMPDWVKLKVMQRASEDMRNIGFTDAEMSTILAGDGAVLAPLFEASGPLTWSPQMWTHLVDQYPTQAAHVLQSAYREAADGLMSGVSRTQADVTNAQYLMRLRGESGKGGLVDMLERAIPGKGGKIDGEGGYQWTRTNFGDNRSAERAFDILERFKTAANSEGDVAAIIKELKDLPARHREAAENQITSLIRQELGRKVDNVKLSELDNPDRLSAPNLTALSNQNFLNALEDVFGPRGKELADGIRLARASTDTLTSISPKYNSRTQLNAEDVKNAGARYEDPAGAEGGVIDKTVGGLASGGLATGGAAALGISAAGGLTVPLLGLAAGKALYNAYKAGKRLSNTERNQLVDFLFRARKAGEGDPLPRKINHGNVLRSAAVNAAVGGTIGGLSSEGDPNAIAAGIVGGAGFGAARKIIRSRSSLIKPPGPVGPRRGPRGPATPVNALRGPGGSTPPSSPPNALSTPPRPPVKAGFGGSSKPLPMDEGARLPEHGYDAIRIGPATVEITRVGNEATINRLKVPEGERGNGAASRALDAVLRQADAEGVTLFLTPERIGDSGLSDAQLKAFYTRHGFASNRGPDRDFSTRATMVRKPRPAEAGSSKLLAGMGGSEGIGAGGGAIAGGVLAPDTNDDGVVDAGERAAGALGGAITGVTFAKVAKGGVNSVRRAMAPQADVVAEGARPLGPPHIARKTSFTAKDGTAYTVDFEQSAQGGVEVTFHPNSGPRATKSAMEDEYAPLGNGTLSDAIEVFRNVEKAIKEDIAIKGEPRYIVQGRTKRQRDLYKQFARTQKPPEGYAWRVEERPGQRDLLTLVRGDAAPKPANALKPAQAGFGFGGGRKPPTEVARVALAKTPAIPQRKPTADELRISESINGMRASNMGDANISERLSLSGINISPDRIEHFAKMTPAQPARVMSPDRVDEFARNGQRIVELRSVGLPDAEIARDLGIDSAPPQARERLFRSYLAAFESGRTAEVPAGPQRGRFDPTPDETVIDPGKGSNLPAPKPTQAGFSFGGGKGPPQPQANALASPPKKPAPVLSRAAEEATRELKAARSAHTRASNKWVMKDDRERIVKPLEDRVIAAENKLAQVLKNDARLKTLEARGRSIIESPSVRQPIAYGVGGAALGGAAIGGYNALMPKDRGERPMSPTSPEFYWTTVVADKDKMVPVQLALKEWGEWPDDTEATGINGKVTKAAIRAWRYDRGLDPDAPMTKADTARLLAGPRGYQDRDGKSWRYGTDGARVSPP